MILTQRQELRGFRSGNGASRMTSTVPMDRDTIARFAPSVLAERKHDSRTDRYTYVPTIQIVEHLQNNGYGVFAVQQSGSREDDRRGFTKHLVRLRPLNQTMAVGQTHPEIVLLNSHDGSSAYRLMAGLFRLVCSNGLIVSESTVEDFRIRHSGNILHEIAGAVENMQRALPAIGERVERFQKLQLTQGEREVFARAALTARYGSPEESPIEPAQILRAQRREDAEPTMWNTLNTVQESIVRGGVPYLANGKRGVQRRRTGGVSSVDGGTSINRAIWQLAEEMAKLKA